ncbi:phosphoglucosamine mutase [Permianibacter aggregans]|uniref:Phosphoglucosamine mutase n=1 Tax=Permianibacter aggregans TaxID=1510150 RepID=A0A4R6UB51_9GAMM|nr:phosphoglucosamine mutase [Permianibacter aggregans]QGX40571.1 phosphoglucosamine mutase [Permianibacter aggregans]TDQ43868.1 phosphoglucosamine mutase [Permianibacter aggregans]
MSKRKFFGTDGIRGKVGQYPITPEFVLKLGWAVGKVLANGAGSKVLIGKDTRISGYMFEAALEAGLSAAGVEAHLLGPMPTPAIAYLTRTLRARAGIVISASHNPFDDNGIKFFSAEGLKLPDSIELEIEAMLDQPMTSVESAKLGRAQRVMEATGRYIEFCKATVPSGLNLRGLTMVVDCAHGATYKVAPAVFEELGATVHTIGVEPNGLNINDKVGATSPKLLAAAVLEKQADIGIALDGDGDRLIMVDHKGEVVDGDEILFIMARDAKRRGHLAGGGVVGTVMSNLGLEVALKELGIDFARAKVGDRYVMELMQEKGWILGGESSGHLICLDKTTTGDGIVSALQVLAALVQNNVSLHDSKRGMHKFPQTLINVPLKAGSKPMEHDGVKQAVSAVEAELGAAGRVLLRPSGTEPLIRVMVEGRDASQVRRCAEQIAEAVRQS